jgi:hypothetical protein
VWSSRNERSGTAADAEPAPDCAEAGEVMRPVYRRIIPHGIFPKKIVSYETIC